jgi:hypothetical protein
MAKKDDKKLSLDELAAQYGYAAAFFFSDPELKRLIERAVKEQWTADKFQARFMATKWYRTRSADARTWVELKARDPAEAKRRMDTQRFQIQQMATQMGVSLSAKRLERMTEDSFIFGWDDASLRQWISAEFKYQPEGGTTGQASTLEQFIRQTAGEYGVQVSAAQVGKWVGQALSGTYTEDHLVDFIRDMARSKYPGMQTYLDQGLTVRDVADPYIQSYASLLELTPDTVQLNDARVQKALQGQQPAKPGDAPQMQTLYDFERDLRKDPRWRRTKNAREQMTNTALGVLQDMGIYA